ncbi:tyrosine-type recombinase/integrase [Flindersiella endophytica]
MNGSVFKRCPCTEKVRQSCKKEHGSWYFVHDLPTLPGARRRRARQGGFGSKAEAQEALVDSMSRYRQAGVAAEQILAGRRMYVVDYLRQWLDDRENLKASTRRSYAEHINLYLVPHLGHVRLGELGGEDIRGMYKLLRQPRRRRPTADEENPTWRLAPARIQRIHATLRKALNDAVRRYRYLDINPAHLVELESVSAPKAKYWNSKQAGAFLDAIVDDRLYPLYHLAVTRGLRRGEIVALRWEDIDLDDGVLEVSRSIVQLGYATEEGTPKSDASQREIVLDDDNVETLKAHRAKQKRERLAHGSAYHDHGLVFAKEDGTPLHPEFVSRHLNVLIKQAACVPRITFHQLRHTSASLMLEAGADLKYVQHVLGHSSITITTKIYLHVTKRLDRQRSTQVANLIPRKRRSSSTDDELEEPAGLVAV